jgi:hypothetical protein
VWGWCADGEARRLLSYFAEIAGILQSLIYKYQSKDDVLEPNNVCMGHLQVVAQFMRCLFWFEGACLRVRWTDKDLMDLVPMYSTFLRTAELASNCNGRIVSFGVRGRDKGCIVHECIVVNTHYKNGPTLDNGGLL